MNFIIGFACGVLTSWMVYRIKKIINNTKIWDENMDKIFEEAFEEAFEEVINEFENEANKDDE